MNGTIASSDRNGREQAGPLVSTDAFQMWLYHGSTVCVETLLFDDLCVNLPSNQGSLLALYPLAYGTKQQPETLLLFSTAICAEFDQTGT